MYKTGNNWWLQRHRRPSLSPQSTKVDNQLDWQFVKKKKEEDCEKAVPNTLTKMLMTTKTKTRIKSSCRYCHQNHYHHYPAMFSNVLWFHYHPIEMFYCFKFVFVLLLFFTSFSCSIQFLSPSSSFTSLLSSSLPNITLSQPSFTNGGSTDYIPAKSNTSSSSSVITSSVIFSNVNHSKIIPRNSRSQSHRYHYRQHSRPLSLYSGSIFRSFSLVDHPSIIQKSFYSAAKFNDNDDNSAHSSHPMLMLYSPIPKPTFSAISGTSSSSTGVTPTTLNYHQIANQTTNVQLLSPLLPTTSGPTVLPKQNDTSFVNQSHLQINLTNEMMVVEVDNEDKLANSAATAASIDISAPNPIERTIIKYRRSLNTIPDKLGGKLTGLQSQPTALPLIAGDDDELLQQRIYITGLEGSRTILPCNVTRPPNDTIDLILWFRGADEKALYSIDARRAPTMQRAKHFSGDELGARAYIDISTRPTGLIIESVKAEDAGEYKCRVDFRKSRSEYRSVQLDVYVPPKEVIIMDEFGQRLNDPVGPFNQGAHLNLICEAEGGKPRPLLYWYKNHELIDQSWTVTAQGIVRNELVLNRLGRSDQGSILYCQVLLNISETESSSSSPSSLSSAQILTKQQASASNKNSDFVVNDKSLLLLKNVNSYITLELNLRPLDVRITTVHRPVIAGQSVDIRCESGGAKPPALITWWKGPKRLEGTAMEDITSDDNRTISTLSFVPQIDDNGQVLACRSDHSVLSDSALEDSWILSVLFAPKLTISFGASIQHDQIREGSNVSLECHVAANPSVTEIGWMFEGRPLQLYTQNDNQRTGELSSTNTDHRSGGGYVQIKGNTLLIYNVDRRHSGRYRCVAANAQGEGQSEDILLKVQYTPVCKQDQRFLYGVAKREPIQVLCSVESDPPEVTFRWMFNNSYDLVPIKNFHQPTPENSMQSIATYVARNKYGYGELLCWASNKLGEQAEPCVYNVIPAGQPQPLRNCVVRNQSMDGLVVYCDPGDDGGLEQHFFIEVFQAEQGQLWTNLSLTEPPVEFVINNVPVSTTFVLVLYASNDKGRSNYVTLSASTMPPGSRGSEFLKFTADFGIKPMMYLLVAVVGSLVVSAIVIMIVSKVRTINKSKGRHEPLSQSSKPGDKLSPSNSSNGSGHNISLDLLGPDNSAMMQMFDLGPSSGGGVGMMPGPSSGPGGGMDLEIMTNSSSLYDDSSNIQLNPIYNKGYNPSLMADGTTATPTSPSLHSSGLNVIIKNPMSSTHSHHQQPSSHHHLDHQSSPSIDSGAPPPFYHSVYNNFATWNSSTAQQQLSQAESAGSIMVNHSHHPSNDLLLMDSVSYYGTTLSPASSTNALINVVGSTGGASATVGGWDQSGSPHHHHHQLTTSSYSSHVPSFHHPHSLSHPSATAQPQQFTIGTTVGDTVLIQPAVSSNSSHVATIPMSLHDETGMLTGLYPLSSSDGTHHQGSISLADPTQTSGYFNATNNNNNNNNNSTSAAAILDHSSSNSSNNNDSGIGTVTTSGSVSNSPNNSSSQNKPHRNSMTIHHQQNDDDQTILSTPV